MESLLLLLSDDDPSSELDICCNDNVLIDEILMLLTSRPRINVPDTLSELKKTVIGFGLQSDFTDEMTSSQKSILLRERIERALSYFEPRLVKVSVNVSELQTSSILFLIEAEFHDKPVHYVLLWDDVMGQFILR